MPARLLGMKVIPGDGMGALLHLNSWALIRAIDVQLHQCGETGRLTIKVRKGRVAGFTAEQESLWDAGMVAA